MAGAPSAVGGRRSGGERNALVQVDDEHEDEEDWQSVRRNFRARMRNEHGATILPDLTRAMATTSIHTRDPAVRRQVNRIICSITNPPALDVADSTRHRYNPASSPMAHNERVVAPATIIPRTPKAAMTWPDGNPYTEDLSHNLLWLSMPRFNHGTAGDKVSKIFTLGFSIWRKAPPLKKMSLFLSGL